MSNYSAVVTSGILFLSFDSPSSEENSIQNAVNAITALHDTDDLPDVDDLIKVNGDIDIIYAAAVTVLLNQWYDNIAFYDSITGRYLIVVGDDENYSTGQEV